MQSTLGPDNADQLDTNFVHTLGIFDSNPIITTIPCSRFKEIWNSHDIAAAIKVPAPEDSSLIAAQTLQVDD